MAATDTVMQVTTTRRREATCRAHCNIPMNLSYVSVQVAPLLAGIPTVVALIWALVAMAVAFVQFDLIRVLGLIGTQVALCHSAGAVARRA